MVILGGITMSQKDKQTMELLDKKLDEKTAKTLMTWAIVMVIAALIHDGDHIRQAFNWHYTIPLQLWIINLVVYVLPVVTIFLIKTRRISACLVLFAAGLVTSCGFVILHLCGSATGIWGIWNYSYFELIRGVTYEGVYYQGIDWLSWVLLFHVPCCCLPGSYVGLKKYIEIKRSFTAQKAAA